MKQRCGMTQGREYVYYGCRGITVCERWRESFEAFFADMGPRPSPKHSIDRIDNNGNYEPGNVRWATWAQQQNNRRSNIRVTIDDESMTLAQAAHKFGISPQALHYRLSIGMPVSMALLLPLDYHQRLTTPFS
jgi:hypothetical protein